MIRRNTWIVLVVFLVMLAAVTFWQRTKQSSAPEEAVPTQVEEYLFADRELSIVGLKIEGPDRTTVVLEQKDGLWTLIEPASDQTDATMVGTAIGQLLSARILSKPDPAMTLEDLGVSKPQYRVFLTLTNGDEIILYIGDQTPTSSGYYVLPTDTRLVGVVSKYNIDQVLNLFTTPPILPTATPTLEPTVEPTVEPEPTATLEAPTPQP